MSKVLLTNLADFLCKLACCLWMKNYAMNELFQIHWNMPPDFRLSN